MEDDLERLAKVVREQRINFVLDPSPEQWPQAYAALFTQIRKIGNVKFEEYRKKAGLETQQKPWKTRLVSSAEHLATKSARAIEENLPPAGWRLLLEDDIFASLMKATSCQNCHGRMLQAHEDPPKGEFPPVANTSTERRESRGPCQCHANGQGLFQKASLSDLFSFQAAMKMVPDSRAMEKLPIKYPDCLYGLRKWKGFEEDFSTISNMLEGNPFASAKESLLFPFLVLEAKSERESRGFYGIGIQAAIPLQRLLLLQHRLRSTAPTAEKAGLAPLVWFLATRGDDVRLYGAYTDEKDGQLGYEVHCLFDGRMTKRDGALGILLLAHHITKWARDTYCPMIQHQIKPLTDPQPDNASCHGRSDATAIKEEREDREYRLSIAPHPTKSDPHHPLAGLHTVLNTPFAWVRSFYDIENHFCGLLLDSSNVEDFIRFLLDRDGDILGQLPRQIRKLFVTPGEADHRCLISEDTLNSLEELWTGKTRSKTPSVEQSLNLWASITVTFYISHEWRLVRQLSYVAVSKPALMKIVELCNLVTTIMVYIQPQTIATEPLKMLIIQLKADSAEHNLAAAICRSSVSLPLAVFAMRTGPSSGARSTTNFAVRMLKMDDAFERAGDWRTREIISHVKDEGFPHASERNKSYLRLSSHLDTQKQNKSSDFWPLRVQSLISERDDAVVVHGRVSSMNRFQTRFGQHEIPNQCVFVKIQSKEQILKLVEDLVMSWTIYRTVRREWKDFATSNKRGAYEERKFGYLKFDLQVYANMIKWITELGNSPRPDFPLPPGVDLDKVIYAYGTRLVDLRVHYYPGIKDKVNSRQKQHEDQGALEGPFRLSETDFAVSPPRIPDFRPSKKPRTEIDPTAGSD